MTYRKFQADYLFDGTELLDDKHVLVTSEDGTVREIADCSDAGEDVERFKGLISPGFINCHCHLELSHLKGLISMKTGLIRFVLSIVNQRKTDINEIQTALSRAESDMLAGGIVAVGDICNTGDTLAQKSARRLDYYNFIELAGWLPSQAQSRFDSGKALYNQFALMAGNTQHLSLNPHAPYSVSPRLWDLLRKSFPHKAITMHNQETAAEDELFMFKRGGLTELYTMMKIDNSHFSPAGASSLACSLPQFESAKNILLVHNTFTSAEDITRATAFSPDLFFCLCPNANLFIEDKLPDIPSMIHAGGNLVVGTDSLASNHQLSVLEEMKTIKKHFPEIETARILQWATSNGARALQFEDKLGDFKAGKKPGLVLIEYKGKEPLDAESNCRRIL
ncbi:MAG: amidohydrolase family protein [Bacteroidota bacterium]|nr:amidohydrolase family protein [Bacteroidota bacterium]MDP4249092.1 amidohydrolase family protein [Bacteroidota bacterium]